MISGNLFVIAAPSGGGKTSLVKALLETVSNVRVSVSHTTRAMRPGEKEGQDYFFITKMQFDEMVNQHAFLEHAKVYDQYYGTSHAWVETQLTQGMDVILEIDWQGARQIKMLFPGAVLIFIVPPSLQVLTQRLEQRQQDTTETIERRMQEAKDEIAHCREFDYLVVNDQFEQAVLDLQHIVFSVRLKTPTQAKKYAALLDNLLEKQ